MTTAAKMTKSRPSARIPKNMRRRPAPRCQHAISDEALVCFVDFARLNDPKLTRDPALIRNVLSAYEAMS